MEPLREHHHQFPVLQPGKLPQRDVRKGFPRVADVGAAGLLFVFSVPVFHFGATSLSMVNIVCLIIFAVASITDFLDGYIARKNNLITSFGKFIDPIADKLLVNTSFILLAFNTQVPMVAVLIMIWRDTIVDAIRMMASTKGKVMAAGMLGKAKTVTQMVAIIFAFLNNIPFAFINLPVTTIFLRPMLAISVG